MSSWPKWATALVIVVVILCCCVILLGLGILGYNFVNPTASTPFAGITRFSFSRADPNRSAAGVWNPTQSDGCRKFNHA